MGKKILIIDDSDQDRKIIKRFLNKAGYEEIVTAPTGQDGLKKAISERPDLVILDTLLPDTIGFEVCRQIRQIEGPAIPRIIMMTGTIDAVDAVRARKVGAEDYCVKTTDCAPILEAVRNLFGADADTRISQR